MVPRIAVVVPVLVFLLTSFSTVQAAWVDDGNIICSAATHQRSPIAIPDGHGGAFIAWTDPRADGGDIYMQRVTGLGVNLWAVDGVGICTATNAQESPAMISDGAGGVMIVWADLRGGSSYDIYAQRVNGSGVAQWPANGVAVCTAARSQSAPQLTTNGAGGAIVVWNDDRASNMDVYAARLTSSGLTADSPAGVVISAGVTAETIGSLIPFGGGGAFMAWNDNRNGFPDIYGARFSSAGVVLDPAGIALCKFAGDQLYPSTIDDGAGGAIIAWADNRFEMVYAQRVNSSGVIQWGVSGIPVGDGGTGAVFYKPAMVSDGAGGAIIGWADFDGDFDIYAQRINSAGARQWLPNDLYVCSQAGEQQQPVICPDESNGAIIAWRDRRNLQLGYDIFAQRVTGAGSVLWTANGVAVCDDPFDQNDTALASDGAGGVMCAWRDLRDFTSHDIYAMHIGSTGTIPTAVRPSSTPPFSMSNAWPNPFPGETSFDVQLDSPSDVSVELFDVSGRRVRSFALPEAAAGSQRIMIDGLDASDRPLPSGVYFCRVSVGSAARTQKLILVR